MEMVAVVPSRHAVQTKRERHVVCSKIRFAFQKLPDLKGLHDVALDGQ